MGQGNGTVAIKQALSHLYHIYKHTDSHRKISQSPSYRTVVREHKQILVPPANSSSLIKQSIIPQISPWHEFPPTHLPKLIKKNNAKTSPDKRLAPYPCSLGKASPELKINPS